jgi:hypothetical protein
VSEHASPERGTSGMTVIERPLSNTFLTAVPDPVKHDRFARVAGRATKVDGRPADKYCSAGILTFM